MTPIPKVASGTSSPSRIIRPVFLTAGIPAPASPIHHAWTSLVIDSTIHGVAGAETCINSLIRKSRAAFYADDYVKHTTHTTMKVNKKDTNIIEKLSEVFERAYHFFG